MIKTIELTKEEKYKLYNKLTKRELIDLLITSQTILENMTNEISYDPIYNSYNPCKKCPQHPSNGGSGICHCTLGNSGIKC